MGARNKVAIIDNGVNSTLLNNSLEHNVFINEQGVCVSEVNGDETPLFSHGTFCAIIIKKFYPDVVLSSIRILDEKGEGALDKLAIALEWCYQNGIYLVNLSFGTTHFRDRKALQRAVNEYASKGGCIVAATANNNFHTYPASFSNVIGVINSNAATSREFVASDLGVDIKAEAEHEVIVSTETIVTQRSNSYATPYITALAGVIINNKNLTCISEVKKALYKDYRDSTFQEAPCTIPDWIWAAYVIDYDKVSNADYSFRVVGIEKADTLIINTIEALTNYSKSCKHIVYLGNERVTNPNSDRFFWCKQNRINQIYRNRDSGGDITIPLIVFTICGSLDEIEVLTILQEAFFEDGYNIYIASTLIDSVLYDLEYIPEEVLSGESGRAVCNFLYWQTYLKQSDAIVLAMNEIQREHSSFKDFDMIVNISARDLLTEVEIICDGDSRGTLQYAKYDKNAVLNTYARIIEYLAEG